MPRKKNYLSKNQLAKKLAKIKALILDVDGVLTDDHIYIGEDGFELKSFHIGDGLTIALAMKAGLEIIIMSNRPSPATTSRMKDLKVKHVIQKRGGKARLVEDYIKRKKLNIDLKETAFIGNDIMDVGLAKEAGIGICVNDAYGELKAVVDYVTDHDGGHGAVREVLELYFKGRGEKTSDYLWS